jgi:hypothetical protein
MAQVARGYLRRIAATEEDENVKSAISFEGMSREGFCQRELAPSLLGLDWSSFETRQFASDGVRFRNPPEFIYYGFSALDAYATAVLAAHFSSESLGALTFTCVLTQQDNESGLCLKFGTVPEHGCIDSGRIMTDLLNSFPQLLLSKGIDGGAVLFLEGEGCPMMCDYPGRMTSSVFPFLRDRSMDLWPEATLTLAPTRELRMRAFRILNFLGNSESATGDLN